MDSSRQNPNNQNIAGFKVVFRTMPKDLEALAEKEVLVKKEAATKKPLVPVPPIPPEPLAIKEIKAKKEKAKISYQEGKSLYRRKFYQEAIEKFEEALKIKPSWLIRWYLNSGRKKLIKSQETALKAKREAEEKARKEVEERLKIEERTRRETEERLRKEAEAKRKAEERLMKEEEEKRRVEEKLRLEKERLMKEEEARKKAEEELKLKREERLRIEEKARKEAEERLKIEEKIRLEEEARKRIKELKPGLLDSLSISFKKFLSLRLVKNISLILLLLGLIIILIYWLGLKELKPKPIPSKPSPPSLTETVLPTSLFKVDGTEIIILKIGQEKNLFQELQKISEKEQKPGSFLRILIKIKNQEEKYASLNDLFQALEINIPQDILANLENNYTLFSYWQKELPTNPFWLGLGGNRLGLVIALSEKEGVSSQFLLWEEKMEEDLESLFLGKKIFFGPKNRFQDGSYKNIQIRYLYLPDQFLSLNYAFFGNKLMITTSAESIKSLIERIVP